MIYKTTTNYLSSTNIKGQSKDLRGSDTKNMRNFIPFIGTGIESFGFFYFIVKSRMEF